jgi:hypothetical protein
LGAAQEAPLATERKMFVIGTSFTRQQRPKIPFNFNVNSQFLLPLFSLNSFIRQRRESKNN